MVFSISFFKAILINEGETTGECSMFGIRDEISSGIWENDETREIRWEELRWKRSETKADGTGSFRPESRSPLRRFAPILVRPGRFALIY
jgi:hypothetical protein